MDIDGAERRLGLRRATREAHDRLDDLISRAGLLGDPKKYGLYLQATWTARQPMEFALQRSGAVSLYSEWPERQVCEALSLDIFDVSNSHPLDRLIADPPLAPLNVAEALGVLYVLEGSALGARLLERQVAAIGMTAAFGARHMAKQTAQPGAWSRFVDLLTRTKLDVAEEALCVEAAVATFERYQDAFQHLVSAR